MAKHLKKIEELFEKSPVVEYRSLQRIVGTSKNSYAKLLVSTLLKKKKIKKLGKGVYTRWDEAALAVFAFKPAYLGLQSAMSHHGLWEQGTIPVILTTKKVRRGIRPILGSNVLIRNTSKKYFFGYSYLLEGNFYLPYADVEKTFIDMIVFRQYLSRELLEKFRERINKKKLDRYLKSYPLRFQNRIRKAYSVSSDV